MHALKGGLVAYAVLLVLLACIFLSPFARGPQDAPMPVAGYYRQAATVWRPPERRLEAPVEQIGHNLVGPYIVPLQTTGLLLTAALIGAALLAKEKRRQ